VLFNSYIFLFAFLPPAMAGYFLAGRFGRRTAGVWLVFVSFVFYGWWNPAFCSLLSISIAFNYGVSLLIARAEARPRLQGWILAFGIAANLAALIYYKYLAWLVDLLDGAGVLNLQISAIVLPLGISFFTFTQIGYLVDCTLGVAKDRGLLNYMLFVTFFPHLVAGPILHNQEIMPQFADRRTYRFSAANVAVGFGIFVFGLLKKCQLADPLSSSVVDAFAHPESLSLLQAWQATLSYSLQLYFDFSGYSDMAIGLARMFNVRFPLNFNSPYKADCIIDFWQRWHMTLTRYLTQYIYTPIAVWVMRQRRARRLPINRAAQKTFSGFAAMIAFPIVVTMALAGIWHGSGAQFLIFGLLHAFYLCVNHAWRVFVREPRAEPPTAAVRAGNVLLTYLCVLVAAVFFRAPSAGQAVSMLGAMLGLHGPGFVASIPDAFGRGHVPGLDNPLLVIHAANWQGIAAAGLTLLRLSALYLIVWLMPNTQEIFAGYDPALDPVEPASFKWLRWRISVRWAVALGCAATLAVLSVGGTSEFLYFQF
jgi:D-alanyl-lipoteichoic acid acyltransferase DltB (MBOAT superfamily)